MASDIERGRTDPFCRFNLLIRSNCIHDRLSALRNGKVIMVLRDGTETRIPSASELARRFVETLRTFQIPNVNL